MRSRLEAEFAGFLDETQQPWLYEERAYATRRGIYLPDFAVTHVFSPLSDPGEGWGYQSLFVEVKGPEPSPSGLAAIQERMLVIPHSEPYAQLGIAWEALMVDGLFLVREARRPDGMDLGAWEFRAWAECRCGMVCPSVIRGGVMRGRCPVCDATVFLRRRPMRLPWAA